MQEKAMIVWMKEKTAYCLGLDEKLQVAKHTTIYRPHEEEFCIFRWSIFSRLSLIPYLGGICL